MKTTYAPGAFFAAREMNAMDIRVKANAKSLEIKTSIKERSL